LAGLVFYVGGPGQLFAQAFVCSTTITAAVREWRQLPVFHYNNIKVETLRNARNAKAFDKMQVCGLWQWQGIQCRIQAKG